MFRSAQRGSRFWMRAVLLVLVLLAGATSAVASPSVRSGGDGAVSPELQRSLDQVVAAGAPGAIALVNDGAARVGEDRAGGGHAGRHRGGVETVASGVADLQTGRPMRAGDRFRAASVTKSMVATVVLQLVAEGRLSLSHTVERWLPGILLYGDRITVRQLVNHTSGVPDYEPAVVAGLYAGDRFRSWRPRDLVALVADQPPDFPAGSAFSYSNTGYVLLGLIVERVTGQRLGRELERRIFRPLRMRDTSAPTNFPFLVGRHANGYSLRLDDQLNPIEGTLFDITVFNPSLAWAAGNVVSDVEDLARFFRGLLGGRLLPPALLADMKTPVDQTPGEASYGLGLIVAPSPCGPLFGHDGGIPGFTNFILSSEDGTHQFAVMVNANAAPAAVQEPFALLTEQAFRDAFAGEPCAAAAPQAQPALRGGARPLVAEPAVRRSSERVPVPR